jgi:hypothetical protein
MSKENIAAIDATISLKEIARFSFFSTKESINHLWNDATWRIKAPIRLYRQYQNRVAWKRYEKADILDLANNNYLPEHTAEDDEIPVSKIAIFYLGELDAKRYFRSNGDITSSFNAAHAHEAGFIPCMNKKEVAERGGYHVIWRDINDNVRELD